MANLKRNMIELLENPEEVLEGGEPQFKKYWTPPFLPLSVVREAMELQKEMEGQEESAAAILNMFDRMVEFVANRVYNKQFTVEDLHNRLHGPDALAVIQNQVVFVTEGNQSEETKKFLATKTS